MEEKIRNAISSSLEEIGVRIIEIVLEPEDGVNTLFIKIDSDNIVDTDLCVKAAEIINPIIDSLDLEIEGDYVLDICSKGDNINE